MARTENGRLAYADLLRVFATLAVVVLHVSGGWLGETTVGNTNWTVLITYDSLVRWCVPVFAMLSGAFLLDPKKSVTYRDIFLKYILRVVIVLLVWGTLYALKDYGLSGWADVRSALNHVLWADTHYHLWFLYIIIGLYLVTPILRAFVRGASRGTLHWFFLLVFVFCFLLPTLSRIFPSAMSLPMTWANRLDIHVVLGYVGYFVAGYYLKQYTLNRFVEFLIYILGILGTAITIWGTYVLSSRAGDTIDLLLEYQSPNVALTAVSVFVLFRYVLGISDERSRRQRMGGMAKITLGIFVIHEFFILFLRDFGISTLSFHPVISVPALSLGVFLCSFALAWLISKIPLIGRLLT